MTWPSTNVMMLGKLRPSNRRIYDPEYPPRPSIDYLPINTTPLTGQNVLRQVVMNGVGGVKLGLGGLGALGAEAASIPSDTMMIGENPPTPLWLRVTYCSLLTASGVVSLYHGYRRHGGSLPWGLAWFAMGSLFPVITPTVAFAQGFGKKVGR